MNKILKQFKKATNHISLSESLKSRMREEIVAYMEYHPIRTSAKQKTEIPLFSFFRAHHFSGAFLIATIIMSSTFGVSFAAGDALPGDLLYGVKVNINEEIKTVFKSSDASRIAWEIERAERRLVEAGQLAAEGRLDNKKQEKVSKLFAEHTEAMVEQVLAYEEVDPVLAAEASSAFEDSLDTHEAVLARLIVEQEVEPDENARELVEQVRSVAMEVEKIREDAEEKIAIDEPEIPVEQTDETPVEVVDETDKTNSANMRVRAAYRAQERAQELLLKAEGLYETLEPESELRVQAEAQVAYGRTRLENGKSELENHNLGGAYSEYKHAAASFQNVAQLLEVAKLFSIDIYPDENTNAQGEVEDEVSDDMSDTAETGTIEEIEDEAITYTLSLRTAVEETITRARTLLLTKEGYDFEDVEKANARIKDAEAQVLRGEIAMVLKDYKDAETLFVQAEELARAVVMLLEEEAVKDDVNGITLPKSDEPADSIKATTTVLHSFTEGIHTYSGTVETPTPCHTLESTALVAESYPEQISLELTIREPESDTVCIQVIAEKEFRIEVTASKDATVTSVKINTEPVVWTLVEDEDEDDADTTETEENKKNILEKAIDSTQNLLTR